MSHQQKSLPGREKLHTPSPQVALFQKSDFVGDY